MEYINPTTLRKKGTHLRSTNRSRAASSLQVCSDVVIAFIFFGIFFIDGILFILIFRNKISNVLIGFLEFHLVHTLSLVPMQESLSPVHSSELSGQSLEDSLQGRGVRNKGGRHL